jgi:hypothetical protein
MVIGRRGVLLAGAGAAVSAALPVPAGGTLGFRMVRNDTEIGHHTLTFERRGETLNVHVAVDALVTVLSVPVVRYKHRLTETWQGERLVALNGDTDKNGQQEWVRAQRDAEGLVVQGSHTERYTAPEEALATTYWDRRMLNGPMISGEDGVLLHPKVTAGRAEPVPLASGAKIDAEHFTLRGSFNADVWYDRTNTWASLSIAVKDGSTVRYERL